MFDVVNSELRSRQQRATAAIDEGLRECQRLEAELRRVGETPVIFREEDGSVSALDFTTRKGQAVINSVADALTALSKAKQNLQRVGNL